MKMAVSQGFWAAALSVIPAIAQAQLAQDHVNPIVVELYTSQGCAACPPADALIDQLAGRSDVMPLALHVDYWDYIGWADIFAKPAFSERQKNYARNAGRASVYTPQMIIGGTSEVKGSSTMQAMGAIQDHLATQPVLPQVTASLTMPSAGTFIVQVHAANRLARAADIQLVRYMDSATVEIMGGENHGKRITYRNIVTAWDVIGHWDGSGPFMRQVRLDGTDPVVLIVQEEGQGQVLAAARTR
jgi:hypothetical protein